MTSVQQTPFPLRVSPELLEALKAAAGENFRSLNQEIAYRLATSLKESK